MANSDLDSRGQIVEFIGVVEDRHDPLKQGRVRVRCFFFHPEDKSLVPTEHLPWARVAIYYGIVSIREGDHVRGYFEDGLDAGYPVVTEVISGIPEIAPDRNKGFNDPRTEEQLRNAPRAPQQIKNPKDGTGIQIVEQVAAPLYPARLNEPKISRLIRNESLDEYKNFRNTFQRITSYGLGIDSLVTGIVNSFLLNIQTQLIGRITSLFANIPGVNIIASTIVNTFLRASGYNKFTLPTTYNQPQNPYNAQYPYNRATVTESGHIQEFDDTPGHERVHVGHRTGTNFEMYPDGSRVDQTTKDLHNIVEGSQYNIVRGGQQTVIEGSRQVVIRGADYVQIEGGSKVVIIGDAEVSVTGNKIEKVKGDYTIEVGGEYRVSTGDQASIKAGTNLTLTAKDDIYQAAGNDLKLRTYNNLYFDIVNFWVVKIEQERLMWDMKKPGWINQPLNLIPLVVSSFDVDTGATVTLTSAEFSYSPKISDDTMNEIERQVNQGIPLDQATPANAVIDSINVSVSGISFAG